jgi:argininosuccinate synthase
VKPQRIALAYSGSLASSAAVRWLMEVYRAEVVTVTVDVGQTDDLEEVYARALACGALRAHVVDRRERFARQSILAAMAAATPLAPPAVEQLADPIIATALLEVAAIEGVDTVAHASANDVWDTHIHRLDPTVRVVAAAREWIARDVDVSDYVKMHHLSTGTTRGERHLLIRRSTSMASGGEAASVTIAFENGIPVSVNSVSLEIPELIESLSLIGGRYGLGGDDPVPAPAMGLLQAAYAASGGRGSVTLLVQSGALSVGGTSQRPSLVNHA